MNQYSNSTDLLGVDNISKAWNIDKEAILRAERKPETIGIVPTAILWHIADDWQVVLTSDNRPANTRSNNVY